MNQILTHLEPDDLLQTDLEPVVGACGIDVARVLLDKCGGTIYIPKISAIQPLIERYVAEQMRHGEIRVKYLARQIGCSETKVRLIMKQVRDRRR